MPFFSRSSSSTSTMRSRARSPISPPLTPYHEPDFTQTQELLSQIHITISPCNTKTLNQIIQAISGTNTKIHISHTPTNTSPIPKIAHLVALTQQYVTSKTPFLGHLTPLYKNLNVTVLKERLTLYLLQNNLFILVCLRKAVEIYRNYASTWVLLNLLFLPLTFCMAVIGIMREMLSGWVWGWVSAWLVVVSEPMAVTGGGWEASSKEKSETRNKGEVRDLREKLVQVKGWEGVDEDFLFLALD